VCDASLNSSTPRRSAMKSPSHGSRRTSTNPRHLRRGHAPPQPPVDQTSAVGRPCRGRLVLLQRAGSGLLLHGRHYRSSPSVALFGDPTSPNVSALDLGCSSVVDVLRSVSVARSFVNFSLRGAQRMRPPSRAAT
jgi:hypothetical protein